MPDTTIRSRTVVPMNRPPIEDGAIRIEDGRIQYVGPFTERPSAPGETVLDLGECALLPGLINAHCHLDYTHMAGMIPAMKAFSDWIKAIIAIKSTWSYTEFAESWVAGAHQLEATGTTTVVDIESVPELLPEAWDATPVRVWSCIELINVRSPEAGPAMVQQALDQADSLKHPRNRCGLSPHALYTTTDSLLQAARQAANQKPCLLTTHLAESREEWDLYQSASGPLHEWLSSQRDLGHAGTGSPTSVLKGLGYLDGPMLAAHVNHLGPDDPALLAQGPTSVAHCPRSHDYFGHAPFPWARLEQTGVNLTLGTDSLASMTARRNNPPTLSLFAEMQCLSQQPDAPPPETILRWATLNGARALGQSGELGELSPGAQADWIAIPHAGPRESLFESIIQFNASVHASMIEGAWVRKPAS